MKNIHAVIRWKNVEEGGREKPLDIGVRYFPTIVRDNDATKTHWSVVFATTPICEDGTSNITFQLLMENATTEKIQDYFVPGTHFCLHEGKRVVASGVVV